MMFTTLLIIAIIIICGCVILYMQNRIEHWRSHYEAAMFNWNQVLDERDKKIPPPKPTVPDPGGELKY